MSFTIIVLVIWNVGKTDIYDEWKDETKVNLIAIATDDARTKKRIRPLVNGKGWEYIVLYDDNQDLKRALNITTLSPFGSQIYQHTRLYYAVS